MNKKGRNRGLHQKCTARLDGAITSESGHRPEDRDAWKLCAQETQTLINRTKANSMAPLLLQPQSPLGPRQCHECFEGHQRPPGDHHDMFCPPAVIPWRARCECPEAADYIIPYARQPISFARKVSGAFILTKPRFQSKTNVPKQRKKSEVAGTTTAAGAVPVRLPVRTVCVAAETHGRRAPFQKWVHKQKQQVCKKGTRFPSIPRRTETRIRHVAAASTSSGMQE